VRRRDLTFVRRISTIATTLVASVAVVLFLCGFLLLSIPVTVCAQTGHGHHSVGQHHSEHALAPIGVMGDHVHAAGSWMLSYRYMFMAMDGNREGTHSLSPDEVLEDFMVSPTKMSRQMHMLGAMWAPSNLATLSVMIPYFDQEMEHVTRMGGAFTTETKGFGDLRATVLFPLIGQGHHSTHFNFGLSIPIGSIDEKGQTPAGYAQLPYPMQTGTGTFDIVPGVTYTGHEADWFWGAQARGTFRLGENDNEYTLGNVADLTAWSGYRWSEMFGNSLRVELQDWGRVDGADPNLNPMMVPTADPAIRAGTRVDIALGMELRGAGTTLEGHRLALEFVLPIHQDLDGPQLESDAMLTAGWQKIW